MNARPTLTGARWAQRPPDQRFSSVAGLRSTLEGRRARARTRTLQLDAIAARPGAEGITLEIDGEAMVPSAFAAGQISTAVGLPAKAIQVLSPELGAAALNERFERTRAEGTGLRPGTTLLLEDPAEGPPRLRGLQSRAYSRTWDLDVVEAVIQPLIDAGYAPAAASPLATTPDLALFSSDRDLFCFLVRSDEGGGLDGPHGRPLRRGVVVRNSEVGGLSLHLRTFWFDSFCTNHMVFGETETVALSEAHRVGRRPPLARLLERWDALGGVDALDRGRGEAQALLRRAATTLVARPDRDPRRMDAEAVEAVSQLARRARVRTLLPRTLLKAGARRARVYAAARHPEATRTLDHREAVAIRGPGITLWHMACGITEASQQLARHTDARARVDAAIGRVLAVA